MCGHSFLPREEQALFCLGAGIALLLSLFLGSGFFRLLLGGALIGCGCRAARL